MQFGFKRFSECESVIAKYLLNLFLRFSLSIQSERDRNVCTIKERLVVVASSDSCCLTVTRMCTTQLQRGQELAVESAQPAGAGNCD